MTIHPHELNRCYQLLDLAPGATLEDLDAAYRQAAYQQLRQGTEDDIKRIRAAYRTLKAHLHTQPGPEPEGRSRHETPEGSPLDRLVEQLRHIGYSAQVKVQDQRLHIGLNLAQAPRPNPVVAKIYTLLEQLDREAVGLTDVETVTVYGLRAPKDALWQETVQMPRRGLTRDDLDLFSFNNRFSNAIIFPAILVLGLLASMTPLIQILLLGIQIWIHEFGHATVAWLAGRRAIPLPLGWTNVGEARSLFVYVGILTLLGLLWWSGRREQRRWPMVLAIGLAVLQFYLTWLISADTFTMLLAFGGIGGEFYLSTLLMVSFYFPLPQYWRWEFWRYPVGFAAAFTFWTNIRLWHHIRAGMAAIPWGSMWGGSNDSGGDMNVLSLDYGWSDQRIIQTYNSIGELCLVTLLALYFYVLIKQNRLLFFGLWQRVLAKT